MVRIGRRDTPPGSIQTELQRLQAIRLAAEQELGRLRTELGERVAAVERRERELADALARVGKGSVRKAKVGKQSVTVSAGNDEALAHAQVGLAARAQDLGKQEADLAARERALIQQETDLVRRAAGEAAEAAKPDARLAQIEARLKALQEAEKAFARTQAELATASDDLARRELAVAERERAIEGGAAPGPSGSGMSRSDLDDLDDRLRRLEQETRVASTERTFGDGLRTLERKGVRGKPPEN